jgi:four helix bundle protein
MAQKTTTHRELQVYQKAFEAHFISKLSDAESEAAETQVWLEFAVKCKYMKRDEAVVLYRLYDEIIAMLVSMINRPASWVLGNGKKTR